MVKSKRILKVGGFFSKKEKPPILFYSVFRCGVAGLSKKALTLTYFVVFN